MDDGGDKEEEVDDNNDNEEEANNNGFVKKNFWICQQFFLDFSTRFFGFVDKNLLDLSTKSFGFVDKIFCICRKNMPTTLSNVCIVTWVTRPERPKGAKDEVKEARRAAN